MYGSPRHSCGGNILELCRRVNPDLLLRDFRGMEEIQRSLDIYIPMGWAHLSLEGMKFIPPEARGGLLLFPCFSFSDWGPPILLVSWQTNNGAGLNRHQSNFYTIKTFLEVSKWTETVNEVYKCPTEWISVCYKTSTIIIYRSILQIPVLFGYHQSAILPNTDSVPGACNTVSVSWHFKVCDVQKHCREFIQLGRRCLNRHKWEVFICCLG